MKTWLQGHLLNLGLALVFSVLIWMAIGSHLVEQNKVTVDFRIVVPADVIVTYDETHSTGNELILREGIVVTIRGPKEESKTDRLKQLALEGLLRLSKAQLDEAFAKQPPHLLIDAAKFVAVAAPLEVIETVPAQLRLEFERVSDHLVWVAPGDIEGDPAKGFRVGEITVSPRRVAVRGPASLLENSYKTVAVPLGGASGNFEVERPLDCPGAIAAPTVTVSVSVVPELEERFLEFPISIMLGANPGDEPLAPLPYTITAREGWMRRIKLRGPRDVLRALEDDLDAARLERIDTVLPQAYVPRRELPKQLKVSDRDDNLRIEVTGLPPGVEIVEPPVLPVTLVRVE